jgi:hypothetical protein
VPYGLLAGWLQLNQVESGSHRQRKVSMQALCNWYGPSYEGLDGRQLRMVAPVHNVEAVTWQRYVRYLHKSSARKFGSHRYVAAQTRKIGNALVVLSGGGLPPSPSWRLRIARRSPRFDQGKFSKLDGREGLSRPSNQLGGCNDEKLSRVSSNEGPSVGALRI